MAGLDKSGSNTGQSRLLSTTAVASILLSTTLLCAFFMSQDASSSSDGANNIISILSQDQNNTTTTSNSTGTAIINNHPSDHDSLIPIQISDVVGFICAALGLIIAAGGGIGGGGILVPIYILILGFLPKHAIPLSNITVFGGAIANTLRNSRKRHPTADRPLIDWDLIVVMEPPTLAGALIGANLNKMLPETAVAILLVLLLSFTSYNTLKKARKMYNKETEEIKRENVGMRSIDVESTTMIADSKFTESSHEYLLLNDTHDGISSSSDDEAADLLDNYDLDRGVSLHNVENINHQPAYRHAFSDMSSVLLDEDNELAEEDDNDSRDLPEFGNVVSIDNILEEERHPRRRNVQLIVGMFGIVLLINILKGGGGFHSPLGIECGSAWFWFAQALLLVWILFISVLGRRFLLDDTAKKVEAGYVYLDDDLKWTKKSTIIYPLISTLAGFAAGMFGIGGGIIKGPLMLAMGIHPAVASATSACMILFTSFTATTTFSVYGLMVPDYAAVGLLLGFCATFIGQTIMSRLLAKSKRNSYIAFSIGFVVLLSACLMALESVLHLVSDEGDDEFGGICDSHLNGHHT